MQLGLQTRAHRSPTDRNCRLALLALFLAASVPGLADAREPIPLDGVYGTEAGCEYHRTLEWNDDPGYFEIQDMALQLPDATCYFPRFEVNTPDKITGPVVCIMAPQNDVPRRQYVSRASIIREGTGYKVEFANGTTWGPLKKC